MSTQVKTLLHGKPLEPMPLTPVAYYVRQRGPATIVLDREALLRHSAQEIVAILRGEK